MRLRRIHPRYFDATGFGAGWRVAVAAISKAGFSKKLIASLRFWRIIHAPFCWMNGEVFF